MSELRSKCCGASWFNRIDSTQKQTKWNYRFGDRQVFYVDICIKCHKPCEVEEKKVDNSKKMSTLKESK